MRFLAPHNKGVKNILKTLLKEDAQVYKQFVENESFKRFVSDMVFDMTNAQ